MKAAFGLVAATAAALVAATPAQLVARASASSSAAASGTSSGSLPVVTVKGNAFFAGNDRFYIRGVDYQPGGSSGTAGSDGASDPIADAAGCKRDIVEFQKLGINTVRVYTVDNSASHDECMSALAAAGIYLALDVNSPHYSLNRGDPAPSYNPTYLQSVFATIDAFANYTNTLLFFSGNEVINDDNTTNCAPYVKAVTRDMKQYIGSRGYRPIPVGYSAADVESNRYNMAQYMNCGTDDQRSDFFAFNDYSWCDPSSYTQAGWDQKVALFGNYSLPLFLSEYGCIKGPRNFEEVSALYGTDMTPVYSGGLVYEYSEEGNNYGLVTINGDTVNETPALASLATALKNNPVSGDGGYKSTAGPASVCPSSSGTWEVTDFTGAQLPAIPDGAVQYMKSGAGKGPGLSGTGSQNAGGASSSTATPGSAAVSNTASSHSGSASSTASSSAAQALLVGELGMAPFVCGAVVLVSTLFGAALV
ncbi:beta-glucanosyltransferase [Meristemomyces frigidus]|uniref:1,3-beta-glucanosyltransferase n=1 Tax=Meristemomyces frigidus TaxID=1508187 RepID=A0AAN7YTC4_9PEZI|nr:beta-glucanosyltransferase [Meristemomyces frigidus]